MISVRVERVEAGNDDAVIASLEAEQCQFDHVHDVREACADALDDLEDVVLVAHDRVLREVADRFGDEPESVRVPLMIHDLECRRKFCFWRSCCVDVDPLTRQSLLHSASGSNSSNC